MAQTDYKSSPLAGIDLYAVDTSQKYPLNFEVDGISASYGAGRFIYLKGVASTAEGSVVTFDEAGVTALIAANAKGPVAVALAAVDANTSFGWYQVLGKAAAKVAAASADNAYVGRETADGTIGDGRAAGDEIVGAISRSATDTPATGFCWLQLYARPFVNDATGS